MSGRPICLIVDQNWGTVEIKWIFMPYFRQRLLLTNWNLECDIIWLKPHNIDLDALDWLLWRIPRCLFFIEFCWTVIVFGTVWMTAWQLNFNYILKGGKVCLELICSWQRKTEQCNLKMQSIHTRQFVVCYLRMCYLVPFLSPELC